MGYPLYRTLLGSARRAGMGLLEVVGVRRSLAEPLPRLQTRFTWVVLILAMVYTLITGIWMARSPLRLWPVGTPPGGILPSQAFAR